MQCEIEAWVVDRNQLTAIDRRIAVRSRVSDSGTGPVLYGFALFLGHLGATTFAMAHHRNGTVTLSWLALTRMVRRRDRGAASTASVGGTG